MADVYSVYDGPSVTTAAPVAISSGTSVRTMIQLSTSANREARVVEWWWEGDGSAAATPGTIELMFVGSGAATVLTAYAAGDIKKYNANGPNSQLTLGTGNSGFWNASVVEGTPATSTSSITHKVP